MKDNKMTVYKPEDIIIREGEISDNMFKIIRGHVEVYLGYGTPHESILGILSEQSCFGEYGVLLHMPALYTVIAYDEVLTLRITEADLEEFIATNRRNVIDIMRNMANNMYNMHYQIDMLLGEIDKNNAEDRDAILENTSRLKKAIRKYSFGGIGYPGFISQQTGKSVDSKA